MGILWLAKLNKRTISSRITAALAIAGLIGVGLFGLNVPTAQATGAAGINSVINYQGRLLTASGAVVPDGTYNMEFQIWQDGNGCVTGCTSANAATNNGGTLKWTEDWVYGTGAPDNRVTVKNGYFSLALGSITSLSSVNFNWDTNYLTTNIGNTSSASTFSAASGDGIMIPFKRMAANPYAINSGQLGGLTSSQYVQLGQGIQAASTTGTTALIGANQTSTGTILDLQKGGADVVLVNSTGSTLFRPTTDSQTALQVQKAGTSTTVFTVDSTNSRIGIGTAAPAYAVDAVGTVNASTALAVAGTTVCIVTGCTATAGSAIQNQNSSQQTSANFWISGTGRADTSILTPSLDTASGALTVGGTTATGVTIGRSGQIVTTAGNVVNNGSTLNTVLALGDFSSGGAISVSPTTTVDIYSSISIAQITANQTLTLPNPTLATTYGRMLYISNIGTAIFTLLGTPLKPGATASLIWSNTNGGASWQYAGADANSILNQSASSQVANFNISGTGTLGQLTSNGGITSTGGDFSVTGAKNYFNVGIFQISGNSGDGSPLLSASPFLRNNLVTYGGFENGTYINWSTVGSGTGLAVSPYGTLRYNDPTATLPFVYDGTFSLSITTGAATANTGAKYISFSPALTSATQYNLSFYAKASGANFTTLRAGVAYNGSTETPCTLSSTTVTTAGFNRYNCTFTSGTVSGSPYLFIGTSDTTQRTFYIDDVQVQQASTVQPYNAGYLMLQGRVISPATFQNSADSTTAFQIQNAAGTSNTLVADTVNNTVTVGGTLLSNYVDSTAVGGTLYLGSNNATTVQVGNPYGTTFVGIQAGTLGVGISTGGVANTIQIGNIVGAVAQTINIGNNATASSSTTLVVGSLIGSSSTTIQSGTGGINLNNNVSVGNILKVASAVGVNNSTVAGGLAINAYGTGTYTTSQLYVNTAANGNIGETIQVGGATPTANAFQIVNSAGIVLSGFTAGGRAFYGSQTPISASVVLSASTGNLGNTALSIAGVPSQSADLAQLRDSNGSTLTSFNATGQLTLGTATQLGGGGTVVAGVLSLADASATTGAAGKVGSLSLAGNLASNQSYLLPTTGGTICLTTGNCSAAGGYIVNGTGLQASSNFNISGTGQANAFAATSLDAAATGPLSIGTNSPTNQVTIGRVGLPVEVLGGLLVDGTATTNGAYRARINGTFNSSVTGTQYGFDNELTYLPSGASLTTLDGEVQGVTISGSATIDVGAVNGLVTGIGTASGYGNTVTTGNALNISAPTIAGSKPITTYSGINLAANTSNGGNTTGTITNRQITIQGTTAAAGTGGTVNNFGIEVVQPAGSGGTTNNYGIAILPTLGTALTAGNYSFYNGSSAASLFTGAVTAPSFDATSGTLSLGTNASTTGISLGSSSIATTVAGSLTLNTGSTFTNSSSTVNTAISIGNFTANGNIGASAAVTVDVATTINIAQTTTGPFTLTLYSPTSSAAGRVVYISNTGTAAFKIGTVVISPNTTGIFVYNGTVWTSGGIDGSGANYIQNTTTTQAANFNVQAATSGSVAAVVTANAAGSGDILDLNNGSGTPVVTVGSTGNVLFKAAASTTAFQIQSSAGGQVFNYDSTNLILTIGNASNNMTFTSTYEPILNGTARHTKQITLTAEYAGGVLDTLNDGVCTSANNGTLTSGYAAGTGIGSGTQNYYKWISTIGSAQCADVVVQVPIPSDFAAWSSSTPLSLTSFTTSTVNNSIKVLVQDSTGVTESAYSAYGSTVTPSSPNAWQTVTAGAIAGTYTANGTMNIRIRLSASNSSYLQLGNLTLSYLSKY